MDMDKPFVHLFFTSIGYFMYDVNKDEVLKIPENVYEALQNNKVDDLKTREYIQNLKEEGYLKCKTVQTTKHPASDILEAYLENNLSYIILQVTQNCNLRCEYCVYSGGYLTRGHSNKMMSWEIAKKGLDFLISHSGYQEELSVGFYGGEPLLNKELIEKCVKYMHEEAVGKKLHFSMTTNATLLNDEIVEFLIKENFSITVSLDGPQKVHDEHRKLAGSWGKGSFDIMMKNLLEIREKYPTFYKKNIMFNTVLDPKRSFKCVSDYISGEDFFNDNYFSSSLISENYKKEESEVNGVFIEEQQYEIFKLMLYKLGKLDKEDVSRIMLNYFDKLWKERRRKQSSKRNELPEQWHHSGPCVPGGLRLFLNAFGEFYPCERVSETNELCRIGNVEHGLDIKKVKKILNIEKIEKKLNCKKCWNYSHCSVCAACLFQDNDNEKQLKRCEGLKINEEEDMKDMCVLEEMGCDFYN